MRISLSLSLFLASGVAIANALNAQLLLMDDPLSHVRVFLRDRTTEFVSSRRKNSPGEAHVEIINKNDFICFIFF